ncbi:ABC transporter [Devosia riboflavina]|uniref:ABC transporter n=1 Tax=Devosia riboflavina TaxID=46914 RepID=A0A087M662_9HYPH|nr:ATP-binding cassette domain-containing protein [Devosia riboflavina]KFL32365.1 ABC transporter [Devosia riboflavina]
MPGLPLAVSGLRLAFAGADVIDLPSLAIAPGTMTVLSGASGSGKSTLLYLLSGLLRPDAGSIAWAGTDIALLGESRRDRWRRKEAGFIFQNFHLIEEMSPLDNVLVPIWLDSFSANAKRRRALDLLRQLDVPAERDSVAKLSRGQQQRVAIARALSGNPSIIFADEPTASLDAAAGETVAAILQRLAREDGRTVVVATHDPALKVLADQSLLLDHGKREPAP